MSLVARAVLAAPRLLAAQTAPPSAGPADRGLIDPEEARRAEASVASGLGRPWELWKRGALAK